MSKSKKRGLFAALFGSRSQKETVSAPVPPVQEPAPAPVIPTPAPASPPPPANEETHKVAGISYHENALAELRHEDDDYSLSKRDLVEYGLTEKRVYRYFFDPSKTELIPEPDNVADPNAIKVVVDGQHIGYIKKGSCAHIRKLLKRGSIKSIDCEITGGPYKIIREDWDEMGNDVYTMQNNTAPYSAKVLIKLT